MGFYGIINYGKNPKTNDFLKSNDGPQIQRYLNRIIKSNDFNFDTTILVLNTMILALSY